jgi:hypothetical protein
MLPIPVLIMEKILPSLVHNGHIQDYVWQDLQYWCNPALFDSIRVVEAFVQEVDSSHLPELQGTERQVEYAQIIREKALRAEAAFQEVLVGSKIMKFSLFPPVKDIDQSRFWIENKEELTRQRKAVYLSNQETLSLYKVPSDIPWSKGQFSIWQSERLNYIWDTQEPELEVFRKALAAS